MLLCCRDPISKRSPWRTYGGPLRRTRLPKTKTCHDDLLAHAVREDREGGWSARSWLKMPREIFTSHLQGYSYDLIHGLGWLGISLFHCGPVMLGLMGIWQKWPGSKAKWWNNQIKVSPTHVSDSMNNPVCLLAFTICITNLHLACRLLSVSFWSDSPMAITTAITTEGEITWRNLPEC